MPKVIKDKLRRLLSGESQEIRHYDPYVQVYARVPISFYELSIFKECTMKRVVHDAIVRGSINIIEVYLSITCMDKLDPYAIAKEHIDECAAHNEEQRNAVLKGLSYYTRVSMKFHKMNDHINIQSLGVENSINHIHERLTYLMENSTIEYYSVVLYYYRKSIVKSKYISGFLFSSSWFKLDDILGLSLDELWNQDYKLQDRVEISDQYPDYKHIGILMEPPIGEFDVTFYPRIIQSYLSGIDVLSDVDMEYYGFEVETIGEYLTADVISIRGINRDGKDSTTHVPRNMWPQYITSNINKSTGDILTLQQSELIKYKLALSQKLGLPPCRPYAEQLLRSREGRLFV